MKYFIYILLLFATILLLSCDDNTNTNTNTIVNPPDPEYTLVEIYSHNEGYFTQGFEFVGDTLIESTGEYGRSKLIKYNYTSEDIYNEISLDNIYFGEGLTVFDSIIYQITWKENKCFKYSLDSLKLLGEFSYSGDGWGLTHDSTSIIMSNGSSNIYFRDPATFDIVREISVKDSNNYSVSNLNELEYIGNRIYANILNSDYIVIIDPETGYVERRINLSDLRTMGDGTISSFNVLNGIALHPNGNIFVTGKKWPNIFEIKIK
ncbi:MAG: glutaminyl-peptide cyclotransferase [Candidatus Delongbacteria bacterium]|nr:glutaminyl-peptide cyclotransferase [Candidatus Delongbacteria bacterium]